MVGGRCYFSDKVFGSAQVGISIFTDALAGSAFTFAPGLGNKISEKFDLMLKYQSATKNGGDASYLGLRAGLRF
jgi:hypothetical protein